MKTGDTRTMRVRRQTAGGYPAMGRTASNFIVKLDGVLVSGLTFTDLGVATGSTWNDYSVPVVLPSTSGLHQYAIEPQADSYSTDFIDPTTYTIDLQAYDDASLANLMLTSQGIPTVLSAADSSLGDIVDGDSYLSATLTMPAGKLSPFSITDISAAGITVEAALMLTPGTTPYPITATVVSGTGLTFTVGWDTQQHPAMTTQSSLVWSMDVQVIKTGPPKRTVTTNRYTFNQVWQRDTRTS